MATEIERKYLIRENGQDFQTNKLSQLYPSFVDLYNAIRESGTSTFQGYLSVEAGMDLSSSLAVPVGFKPNEARLRDQGGDLYFTLKGHGDLERDEFEAIIIADLFYKYWPQTNGSRIYKSRLSQAYQGLTLELDLYYDRELITAEVEFKTAQEANNFEALGLDVTFNPKYKNRNLAG